MQRKENIEKEEWNEFVAVNAADGGLLQSWKWGELEAAEGRTITRLAWEESGELAACCLLVERRLRFGWKYLYAPRGPVVRVESPKSKVESVLRELEKFARGQGAIFLRIEPPYTNNLQLTTYNLQTVQSVQPQQTLRIDLTQSDEQLLAAMHQKTRYNIGLAEKRGVQVNESKNQEIKKSPVDIFFNLLQTTTTRDGFRMHTKDHYSLLTTHYSLFIASLQGIPLAAAIVAFFGTTAYYLHGASANEHRDVMAPYALHWHIMREAKRRGCTVYDLWGIDEKKWPGVTRFKRGFAPKADATTYAGTFDMPVRSLLYRMYRLLLSLRG